MPKCKSHKGLAKRVKITGTGKVKHKRRGKSHLNSSFSGERNRKLKQDAIAPTSVAKKLERALHRRLKGREQ